VFIAWENHRTNWRIFHYVSLPEGNNHKFHMDPLLCLITHTRTNARNLPSLKLQASHLETTAKHSKPPVFGFFFHRNRKVESNICQVTQCAHTFLRFQAGPSGTCGSHVAICPLPCLRATERFGLLCDDAQEAFIHTLLGCQSSVVGSQMISRCFPDDFGFFNFNGS